MIYKTVKSSNLASVGYDPHRQVCGVTFKSGRKFEYASVTPEQFKEMMDAESVGSFFASNIRVRKNLVGLEVGNDRLPD